MIPGINIDIPESAYFALDACSNSRLTDMLDSAAECKFNIDHPTKPTQAMILGSAVDTLVFTPEEFNNRFTVAEQCAAVTQKKEQCSKTGSFMHCGRWYCGTHAKQFDVCSTPLKSILTEEESKLAFAMREAVFLHATANQILTECDSFQVSLLWDFQGLPCKARLDGAAWDLDGGTIVDLKKTSPRGMFDAKEAFSRTLYNYGYHRQAAMYRWGAQQCGKQINNVVFIVVDESKVKARLKSGADDKRLNECVNVYRLRDESLYFGEMQLQPLLAEYHQCWTSGEWPYSEELIDVGIPIFTERLIERSIA